MHIIRCMIDIIRMRRLVKIADSSFAQPLDSVMATMKSKYKRYDYKIIRDTVSMAAREGYVDIDTGVVDKKTEYIQVTDVKGRRLLNRWGFIEAILGTYNKTATFINGALFVMTVGTVVYLIKTLVKFIKF